MPLMNGFEFLEKFKEIEPKIKDKVRIIVLTSSSDSTGIERIKAFDIKDYLAKPLSENKLKETLNSI